MENRTIKFGILSILVSIVISSSLFADSSPILNKGKKWQIGYYEGGPYSDYTDTMRTLIKALIEFGWIKSQKLPEIDEDVTKPYWGWLSQCSSHYLSFKVENSYSANWDEQKRIKNQKAIIESLQNNKIDLVLAMGTWAGQDLAHNKHDVPVVVLSTSDPIRAGIIKSIDNSGYNHVTARVDPRRYVRQIRMFHRIVGFKTLGVAYENTSDGHIYSAIDEIQKVSKERGFRVIMCNVLDTTSDHKKSDASCIRCYKQLAQQVDAIYITALTCVDRRIKEIVKIFRKYKTPSFSMIGSKFVKKGLLLSISSDSGYNEIGKYYADKIARILNGTKPIELKQEFEDPLDIAVNSETARQIGFDVPKSILTIATEIYEK